MYFEFTLIYKISSNEFGGAIYLKSDGFNKIIFIGNKLIISHCEATYGGAISYFSLFQESFRNLVIINNKASD